jgi:shikimate dehydrogenase
LRRWWPASAVSPDQVSPQAAQGSGSEDKDGIWQMGKTVFLIGYPLKHSVSSAFQRAAFDHHHLDVRYENRETDRAELETAVKNLRRSSVLGANVTIPHKERVLSLLDDLDESAARIGAVNTIVNRGGRLLGFNTDAPGFLSALRYEARFECRGVSAVLLGAGGAARAVGFALVREGAKRLMIANRSADRAEKLAAFLRGQAGHGTEVVSEAWESLRSGRMLPRCDLLVNCTSLGMKHSAIEGQSPLEADAMPDGVLVCDLVYNPEETPLLKEARRAGAVVLGGLPMLVYQGAASFGLWTGKEPPLDIMFRKAREALGLDADSAA